MQAVYFIAAGGEIDRFHKIRLESGRRFTIPPGGAYVEDERLLAELRASRGFGTLYREHASPAAEAAMVVGAVARVEEAERERDALAAELAELKAQKAASLGAPRARRKPGPKPRPRVVPPEPVTVEAS